MKYYGMAYVGKCMRDNYNFVYFWILITRCTIGNKLWGF